MIQTHWNAVGWPHKYSITCYVLGQCGTFIYFGAFAFGVKFSGRNQAASFLSRNSFLFTGLWL